MICTPIFIEVYNESFKFIHEYLGAELVEKYWERLAPIVLADLKEEVEAKGLKGAEEYWDRILTAEGAEYRMFSFPNNIELNIDKCPSLGHLEEPYCDYCGHCDTMYRQLFESLDYKYAIEKMGDESCHITVSK